MFNQEPYKSARYLATKYHSNQLYDDMPYIAHVENVFNVLKFFNVNDSDILVASLLHDTLEDTSLSYNKIKDKFGLYVAELVYAVTNELGRNRHERHVKTLPKIQANPEAIILKLGDRVANIKHSLSTNNNDKYLMYVKEYKEFRTELYPYADEKGKEMFKYLDTIMEYKE